MKPKKLIVLSGPTAVGKSNLAIRLALYYNIPILSADSRQIFRRVDIGTAKPNKQQLSQVKHYFIDHIDIHESYSVGQYFLETQGLIKDLFKVYDKVLICGGTGLYIKAVLQGLDSFPDVKDEVRKEIRQKYEIYGIKYLTKELENLDPNYFAFVDLSNPRRLMRALEVCVSSGRQYSDFLNIRNYKNEYLVKEVFLNIERNELYKKINCRVDNMIAEGLLNELLELKEFRHTQALNTVGYAELLRYYDQEWTIEEAIDKIKQHTRNYAKRQITWFKKFNMGVCLKPQQFEEIKAYIDA